MNETVFERRRKSERLTPDEYRRLKQVRKRFDYITDMAEQVGLSREVLTRVLQVGSGAPETIEKVRAAIIAK